MGAIDSTSGQYIYDAADTFEGVPVQDVLNRAQNAAKTAATADRQRLSTLEGQVAGGYGAIKLAADQTVGPTAAVVGFASTELSAGVTRVGSAIVPQTPGIYLVSFAFSATPSNSNTWRTVWLERWVVGAWTRVPLSVVQASMGPNGQGQYATLTIPVALAADGTGLRLVTDGSTGSPSVVISSANTFLSIVKVSA